MKYVINVSLHGVHQFKVEHASDGWREEEALAMFDLFCQKFCDNGHRVSITSWTTRGTLLREHCYTK